MTETTTVAPMTTVLAELVLIATRDSLPTPRYMTVSDGEPFKQISLTLGNRSELDAWNAAFGNVHVSELPPRPDAQDVLLTTMHGGWLLGWTVNLNARVPAPLSPEVLAALGEAARSDAQAIVAESLAGPATAVWDDSVPPGGWVCSVCGTPVESEPCEVHGAAVQS